jgi:hypothetical protein
LNTSEIFLEATAAHFKKARTMRIALQKKNAKGANIISVFSFANEIVRLML